MSRYDQESVVYGVIRHLPSVDIQQANYERSVNRSAIDNLPSGMEMDDLLLMREMFAQSGSDVFARFPDAPWHRPSTCPLTVAQTG